MLADDITKILAGLGIGTGAGAVLTAVINTRSQRGKSRAEAADLLVSAAERVGKLNASLDDELTELKARMDRTHYYLYKFLAEEITREELLDGLRIYSRDKLWTYEQWEMDRKEHSAQEGRPE